MDKKVLIVDDIQSNLQVVSQIFKGTGYRIALAHSGKSALDILSQDDFDLILLDIMMPEMDGFEVCRIIRQDLKLEIPIVFLSANTDKFDVLHGFDIGGQDYITKPFDKRELLARVETQIELYQAKKQLKLVNRTLEEKVAEQTKNLQLSNQELTKANEKLQLLDDVKIEFLGIISHELRTPLHGIRGFTELIDIHNDSEEISGFLRILYDSIQRLDDFILLALNITSLKLNKYNIKQALFNIGNGFNDAIRNYDSLLRKRNVSVKLANFESPVILSGEALLINKAVNIIMENAIKHTRENTEIIVSYENTTDYHIFNILDKGLGFNEEIIKNDIPLFFTGNKHCDNNMGLNLPLANLIIIAHNGKMIIGNHSDGGGLVRFMLPANQIA